VAASRRRVAVATALLGDPTLVLLDEPSGRLDLGGREQLVAALEESIQQTPHISTALITHHVDEIPRGMTHVLFLKNGSVMTAGTMEESFTAANLSECFEMKLELVRRADQRFSAWATQT
jgi:iron complex transport system ATP-binding protein